MEQERVEQLSEEPVVESPRSSSVSAAGVADNGESAEVRSESGEVAVLRAKVQRLEAELERYRAHAQRTSRLFLSASNFADWVRESARRDAEITLRKARARADRLGVLEEDCERAEQELTELQNELEHMRALTHETRSRLAAFLTAGLQALNADEEAGGDRPGGRAEPAPEAHADLRDTLHERLESASTPAPAWVAPFEQPEP